MIYDRYDDVGWGSGVLQRYELRRSVIGNITGYWITGNLTSTRCCILFITSKL